MAYKGKIVKYRGDDVRKPIPSKITAFIKRECGNGGVPGRLTGLFLKSKVKQKKWEKHFEDTKVDYRS
jgi:hypothetical protein